MAEITEVDGNIFDSKCQVLVNSVNCDGVMGKGIALEFKKRFPKIYSEYKVTCEKRLLRPGMLQLNKQKIPWILNFPTKDHWKYPSRIEYIDEGLKKLASTYKLKDITSIALPELGASAGGLQWSEVRKSIYKYLEPLANIKIEIYHFDPSAKDKLFDKLLSKIIYFNIADYQKNIGLGKRQSEIVSDLIKSGKIKNMMDIQHIKGIGQKSVEKIYEFALADENTTEREDDKQPGLF